MRHKKENKTTSPIEKLFDSIEWEVVQELEEEPDRNELPFVTHHGILRIGECELEVVQLSTGQRLITDESLVGFFAEKKRGKNENEARRWLSVL